jgi:hypothetical protein
VHALRQQREQGLLAGRVVLLLILVILLLARLLLLSRGVAALAVALAVAVALSARGAFVVAVVVRPAALGGLGLRLAFARRLVGFSPLFLLLCLI